MDIKKQDLLYAGKARSIFATNSPQHYIIKNRDDISAFNAQKKSSFKGKGSINNKFSNIIFNYLENFGVKTHFIKEFSQDEVLAKKVSIFPLEVVVRNYTAGSFCARYGIGHSKPLSVPLIEYFYKNDELNDPMVCSQHIYILNLANESELSQIKNIALKVNNLLIDFFHKSNLILADFKIELGKDDAGDILLADEISPDTCRLWDKQTSQPLDKDVFRQDLGNYKEAYEEALRRITINGDS